MPYKTFTNGFPLNASELNTFVMPQTNAIFADATERSAAIATPIEGQLSYLQDQNKSYRWDGSAWVELYVTPTSPNYIINGAFEINQRGFSTQTNGAATFTFDRWLMNPVGAGDMTVSSQTFGADSPVSGWDFGKFARIVTSGGDATTAKIFRQKIEDVATLANSTITISFYAKAASGTPSVAISSRQIFGTGGSTTVENHVGKTAITTSWARYSFTYAVPSISGKTVGAGSNLEFQFWTSAGSNFNTATNSLGLQNATIDLFGVQVEAGSVATPFRRNANSLQGELAACQRYYVRYGSVDGLAVNTLATHAMGFTSSTTEANCIIHMPVTMRAATFTVDYSNIALADSAGNFYPITSVATSASSRSAVNLYISGLTGLTANRPARVLNNANGNGFIGLSTEL